MNLFVAAAITSGHPSPASSAVLHGLNLSYSPGESQTISLGLGCTCRQTSQFPESPFTILYYWFLFGLLTYGQGEEMGGRLG